MTEPAEHDAAGRNRPGVDRGGPRPAVLTGCRRPGPRGDRRVQRRGQPSASTSAPASTTRPPPPTASWPTCPATRAGSGPSWSPPIRAPTTPPISEVVLVPGPTALLAPQWVPWQERVQPGDLGPGDLLAPPADDPRLVPGYLSTGDPELDELAAEIGLRPAPGAQRVGPHRRRAALARRRLRARFGDGPVHPPGLPRLRLLPAAGRIARHDVRGVRQRAVRRRPRRGRRVRLRRAFGHACAGRHRLAAVRPVRRRRARPVEPSTARPRRAGRAAVDPRSATCSCRRRASADGATLPQEDRCAEHVRRPDRPR